MSTPLSGMGQSRSGRRFAATVLTLLVLILPTAGLRAQGIAQRVSEVRDGKVRMSFATRPGVCGNGRNITTSRDTDDWESWCEAGPARVVLTRRGGELTDVDTYVGGRWRTPRGPVVDLGTVPAAAAGRYLMSLAADPEVRVGKEAIFPATIADSITVWPQLLEIARDRRLPRRTRKSAVFWLGQAAGDAAVGDLSDLVDDDDADLEIREQAVFALSQLSGDRAVPALIEIARTHDDPRIRRKAMFWLGQSDDPRVIALFEEILLGR